MAYIIPNYKELGDRQPNRPINSRGNKTGLGHSSPSGALALLAFLGPQGAAVSTLWGQKQCQLLSLISWCTSHASNHHLSILYIHGTVW